MAKLNISFANDDKTYSYDTATAKAKSASIQKKMQNSDPRANNPVTQVLIRDLSKRGRVSNMVRGALKSTAGGLMDMEGALYQSGQNARSARNQQTMDEYKSALSRAQKELSDMQVENARSPGAWGEVDLQAQRNILEDARRKYDAMNMVIQGNAQQRATESARDFAGDVTASGMRDVETAKDGLGAIGKLAVDAGVAGTQMAADVGMAALTGGSALIPMAARSFGGGTQDARQSGASFGQQLAYGVGNAAIQAGTEKMFSVAAPFKKMFGAGVLDKALEKATSKLTGNAAGRAALSALSEASEETVAGLLDPILRAATLGETPGWDAGQILQESLVGGILGLAGAGVEVVAQKRGNTTQEAAGAAQAETVTNYMAQNTEAQNAPVAAVQTQTEAPQMPAQVQKVNSDSFLQDILTGKKRVDSATLTNEQFDAAAEHGLNIDAGGNVYRPLPTEHIDRRTMKTAGARDMNAFQFDHPELHDYYKAAAESLIADADISMQSPMTRKTERTVHGKKTIQSIVDSAPLRSAMDMGLSRNQIITAAQALVNDHGQENYAAAKRLEFVLDDMLTNGYAPLQGETVGPNSAYVAAKSEIAGSPTVDAREALPIWDMPELADSLGSAKGGFDPYSQLQNQTATFHDDGANAGRVVDVPKTNFEGRNVPESAKTVMGAQATDADTVRMIEQQIADGTLAFDTITDEKSVAKAQNTIREKSFDGAMEQYRASVESNVASKDNTTLGQQLLVQAMRSGDSVSAAELLSMYTRNSTTAAQAMQAQSIFRKLSPEGQLVAIQKAVDSFNQKHDTTIEIDPEDVGAFVNATDETARNKAAETIFKHVAEQAPGTFTAKFDAIRYLAMLGNPRTHIRNIVGNTLFQIPVTVKNRVGGVADAIASALSGGKYERTKSITGVSPTSQLAKESRADWANAKDFLSRGSKYVEGQTSLYNIESEQKAFKDKGIGKAINTLSETNSALLEAEDTIAKKLIYTQSLAGYLKANGITSIADADPGLLNRARSYAAQEALRNTFNDTNALSEAVSSLNGRRSSDNKFKRASGYVVEGVLPFKKTPANILMRGVEYSPVGVVLGGIDTVRGTMSGDTSQVTRGLDRIASGVTGSALMAAGMLASGAGWVTGGGDEDKRQRDFDKLTGHQEYALELKNGTSVTLDWLAPAAIPFFMGVQLQSAMEDSGLSLDDLKSVIDGITDPMLEMTMLQGLNDVVESGAHADQRGDNAIAAIATSALTNYITQVFPTAFGQIERAGDKVRETTYADKNSKVPTDLQYLFGKVANKIPGVDYNQIPYIDAWGRTEDQGSATARVVNNIFNPAFVSDVKVRPVEKELQRIADKTGRTSVFPQRAETKVNYSVKQGEDKVPKEKNLTSNEYLKYATALGKEKYTLLNVATSSAYYKSMTDDEKADYVGKLYQYAKAQAVKTVATGAVNDAWIDNARTAKRDIGVSTPEYIALHEKYGSALAGNGYEKVKTAFKAGISVEAYMGVRETLDGNGNGSVSQSEARAALDASGFTRAQKSALWKTINAGWKQNPYG